MSKIIKRLPNLKYLLVGEGDDMPRVKKLVKEFSVSEYVVFTGFISDAELPYYYNLCDVFVMPSKREGFGIVFLEALAYGKPVIAGNKGGSPDALLDGKLGILVDPDNVDQIANAIVDVLEKKVSAHLLDKDYLRKAVLENFGFKNFSNKLKEIVDGKN